MLETFTHISHIRPSSAESLGFTLAETLIVLGISAVFVNISLINGIDVYERGLARTDRELLAASVREARAQAMSGVCASATCTEEGLGAPSPHGVYIAENGITLFEGKSYLARHKDADVFTPFSASETPFGASEVVFAALSGDCLSASSSAATVLLTGADHHSEAITVNSQGVIEASTL